ncbi:MAG: tyrosine--tRNA ligase [Candidatus Dadabacteria bacterium]|nr:MAG: tyrosine--tRNA ligase [Candidatus Dadabacteria bacterium]
MGIIDTLKSRGLFYDASEPEAINKLAAGTPFYVGFDPTARSLQLGNLVPIIGTAHLARLGLRPIILFGGATGAIGDPSGKSEERKLLDRATIDENIARQTAQFEAILNRLELKAEFVNNYDWTADLTTLDFLRDIGKHFTVNYMLQKESVKTRLASSGLSFTEFSYMILQAYDFLHLYKTKNCVLQIGGSDQWGNITAGLELIRKKIQGTAYALALPLVTDSEGKKFGKSESGAIWLDPDMTSPYRLHQFLLNTNDSDVIRFIRQLTFIDEQTIEELKECVKNEPHLRKAQKALADAICTFVHGEEATKLAKRSAEVLFGGSIEGLSQEQLEEIFSDVPSSSIRRSDLKKLSVTELFSRVGLTSSKGEAKKLIQNGGAYISNKRINDIGLNTTALPDFNSSLVVLRAGKKSYHLLKIFD